MDCMKSYHPSTESTTKSKFAKTLSKCINPQTPSRFDNGPPSKQLKTLSQELNMSIKDLKSNNQSKLTRQKSQSSNSIKAKEALLAKLFASVSSIKAAYAELQNAQFPYNGVAVHTADQAVVRELAVLSELKQKYLNNVIDLPASHVTQLLAEIQEQQSNIKTFEISIKQLQLKVQQQESEIDKLRNKYEETKMENKSHEKRLNSSGIISPLLENNILISDLNQCHFIRVVHYVTRSVRHFVKHLVRNMELKEWDLDLAAKAIQPNTIFTKPRHKIFAIESYVSQIMFDGFNHHTFFIPNEEENKQPLKTQFFENFKKIQSLATIPQITENPRSPLAKFCKEKYLKVVHPKIECSLFGNLDQRKAISVGVFPRTEFFGLFGEMARRVWVLHCLGFSFEPPAMAFQVKKGSRFSEIYMESVAGEDDDVSAGELTVAFTVVPGFKIGQTVVQSQVYVTAKEGCVT